MLKQTLQQKLQQRLSPQQIHLMQLLQIPTATLEQRIKKELEENPALEEEENDLESKNNQDEEFSNNEDDALEGFEDKDRNREEFDLDQYIDDDEVPAYKLHVKNVGPDDERKEVPVSSSLSFQDYLNDQLGLLDLDERQMQVAEFLVGNIDDDGYMRRELAALVDDLAFTLNIHTSEKELNILLGHIQGFDPPGIGARNLQDCLTIQLKRKLNETHDPVVKIALLIVEQYWEEFQKKHFEKIAQRVGLDDASEGDDILMKDAVGIISKLNPRPGDSMVEGQKSIQHLIPDFILRNNDGILELNINSRNAPQLRVSNNYIEMLDEYSKAKIATKDKKEAVQFVKQKIDGAKWFIDAITQRNNTLLTTMQAIINYQYEYFLEGDETKLKPMILKDIADKVGLDISTVSRVTNSKYIQTPFGTLLLKSFFSESLSNSQGEEVSTREVKKILEDCIAAEKKNKPLTDDKLTQILKEKGYNIARRTVAKYREQLKIPIARMRKEI